MSTGRSELAGQMAVTALDSLGRPTARCANSGTPILVFGSYDGERRSNSDFARHKPLCAT